MDAPLQSRRRRLHNDLTTSDIARRCLALFVTGSSVSVIAPKEPGAGLMKFKIDGQTCATVDLSTNRLAPGAADGV